MPPAIFAKSGWPFWDSLNLFKWANARKKKDASIALRDVKHHFIMDRPDVNPYVATTILPRAQPAPELEPQFTEDVAAFFTKGPNAAMPEASGQTGGEVGVDLLPALLHRQEGSNHGFSSVQLPRAAEEEPKREGGPMNWLQEEANRRSVEEKGHGDEAALERWVDREEPQDEAEWDGRAIKEASVIRNEGGTNETGVIHQDKQTNDTSPGGYDLRLPNYVGGHCGPLGVWRDACPEEYFHALDAYGSGSGIVIAIVSLGVASSLGLLAVLGTAVVCGCRKRRKKKKAKRVAERTDVEAVWPGSKTTGKAG